MKANGSQLRLSIAQLAARLIVAEGLRDYGIAKRKAARRLGVIGERHLPRNDEVEQCVVDYQRLFHGGSQPGHMRTLRQAAVDAMRLFEPFTPRLTGAVLAGTADAYSTVALHLFADGAERVGRFLHEHGIPAELGECRLRAQDRRTDTFPVYRFLAGDVPFELTVFPVDGIRWLPKSPLDGKSMRRASRHQVLSLLDDDASGIP